MENGKRHTASLNRGVGVRKDIGGWIKQVRAAHCDVTRGAICIEGYLSPLRTTGGGGQINAPCPHSAGCCDSLSGLTGMQRNINALPC